MDELKPCPFCGGEAFLHFDAETRAVHKNITGKEIGNWVTCKKCFAESGYCHTTEAAIEAWNRRVKK